MTVWRSICFLLCVLALGGPVAAAPSDSSVAIANADFERVVPPAPGAYGCCFSDWLFSVRSGAYGLSPHAVGSDSTYARLTSRGKAGRADLMSPSFALEAFAEVRVRARVRREGTTGVVALHPPYERRHVDLALLTGREGVWQEVDVTLRAGVAEGDYRVTFGVVGAGFLEIDDVKVDLAGRGKQAEGTVLVVDLNDRAKDYVAPEGWWVGKDIAAIWGYDVVTWSYHDLDEKRLKRLAPVAMILSPYAGKPPPGDAKVRAKARRDTYPVLKKTKIPTLGICFGHQWLGWSKGVKTYTEGESGDVLLACVRRDPIFEGVPDLFPCSQSHKYALVGLPPGFHLLAKSEQTAIHAIKDKRRLVYGFQGHFERGWEGTTPHGRLIWGNFFRLVEQERRR